MFMFQLMKYADMHRVLCQGDEFSFNGHTYTTDTLLHDTIFEGYGCGTDYTVWIQFRPIHTYEYSATTREDIPYIWAVADTNIQQTTG